VGTPSSLSMPPSHVWLINHPEDYRGDMAADNIAVSMNGTAAGVQRYVQNGL
jgi:hypothetical protein